MYSTKFSPLLIVLYATLLLLVGCREDFTEIPSDIAVIATVNDSPHLLSVEEASVLLNSPSPPLLIEISKPEKFAQGHIPGAVNLWRPDYEDKANYPYGGIRATKEEMTGLLSGLGAQTDSLIIIYCTKGSVDAARFLWIMRGYGHQRIAMINGGKAAWQQAKLPLTQEATPLPPPGKFQFPKGYKQTDCAYFNDVIAAVRDSNVVLIDTREDYEFLGIPHLVGDKIVPFKPGAFMYGNIPGSIHINWSEAVDLHGDHTFKSLKDLKYNFTTRGITPDKKIIVYCQSGVRSAHTLFVLSEILGYPDVSNYDGSWIEWSYLNTNAHMAPVEHHTSEEDTKKIYADLVAGLSPEYKE